MSRNLPAGPDPAESRECDSCPQCHRWLWDCECKREDCSACDGDGKSPHADPASESGYIWLRCHVCHGDGSVMSSTGRENAMHEAEERDTAIALKTAAREGWCSPEPDAVDIPVAPLEVE